MTYRGIHAPEQTVTVASGSANDAVAFLILACFVIYLLTGYLFRQHLPRLAAMLRRASHLRRTAALPLPIPVPRQGGRAAPAVPWQFETRAAVQAASRAAYAAVRRAASARPVNGQNIGWQPRRAPSLEPITVRFAPVLTDPLAQPRGTAPWDGMTDAQADRWATLVMAGDTGSWSVLP